MLPPHSIYSTMFLKLLPTHWFDWLLKMSGAERAMDCFEGKEIMLNHGNMTNLHARVWLRQCPKSIMISLAPQPKLSMRSSGKVKSLCKSILHKKVTGCPVHAVRHSPDDGSCADTFKATYKVCENQPCARRMAWPSSQNRQQNSWSSGWMPAITGCFFQKPPDSDRTGQAAWREYFHKYRVRQECDTLQASSRFCKEVFSATACARPVNQELPRPFCRKAGTLSSGRQGS